MQAKEKFDISHLLEYSIELAVQDEVEQLKGELSLCLRSVQWPSSSVAGKFIDVKYFTGTVVALLLISNRFSFAEV